MEKDRIRFQEECEKAVEISRQTLFQILRDNKDTEYGKKYNFVRIENIEDFRKLPITDYEDYKEEVIRMMKGEENVLTAYPVKYFLTSSITSNPMFVLPSSIVNKTPSISKLGFNFF